MGVYIKGMAMPKNGNETILRIQPDGTVLDQYGHRLLLTAVPVPPHGRLIDASEKIRVQIYDDMTEDYHFAEMTIDDLLSQGWVEAIAPTIIPADHIGDANEMVKAEEGE